MFVNNNRHPFKKYSGKVTLEGPHLRTDPPLNTNAYPVNFILSYGGMGDYLCWLPALRWVAEQCPFIHGRIFCSEVVFEFARHHFSRYETWKIFPLDRAEKIWELGSLVIGLNLELQNVNATGWHLADLGFMYFTNQLPPSPADGYLLKTDLPPDPRASGRYAVVTTAATAAAKSRTVPGEYWTPVLRHIQEKGITPVLLGKKSLTNQHAAIFPEGLDTTDCIDLRDQTSIMQAAAITQHAQFTIGLDNGILHLAACMADSNVIFGYNIASPEQREPRRNWGHTVNVTLERKDLACIHCQTHVKMLNTHDFLNCLYKDNKCIELLFRDEARLWRDAIDRMISEAPKKEVCLPARTSLAGNELASSLDTLSP